MIGFAAHRGGADQSPDPDHHNPPLIALPVKHPILSQLHPGPFDQPLVQRLGQSLQEELHPNLSVSDEN